MHPTYKIPDAVIKTVYHELNKLIYVCDYIWCDNKEIHIWLSIFRWENGNSNFCH